MSGFIMNIKK